jgi:hypothetical protein
MAKSKNRKKHKQKVQSFKEKQSRKKNMVNNYFQAMLAKEMENRKEEGKTSE